MRKGQVVTDKETDFPDNRELVSTTDRRGVITYANQAFSDVSGYTIDELVGKNHNLVRHPDMPKAAFKDLWDCLGRGQAWRGVVKNLCKDGSYYWVDAFVTPIYENGEVTGYQSVRVKPERDVVKRAQKLYDVVNKGGKPAGVMLSSTQKYAILGVATLLLGCSVGFCWWCVCFSGAPVGSGNCAVRI